MRDSQGVERFAPLFFVSPTQINYEIPNGTANGPASVVVESGDGTLSLGIVLVATVAPGLFSANSNGQGSPAAVVLRVKADNSQIYEPAVRFDAAQNKNIAVPIDLGPSSDQVFLILYGTGIRQRSSLSAVTVTLGGENARVDYAGPQGGYVGLDQINLLVPRSLIGRGEVDLVVNVDGAVANIVRVQIK